MADLYATTELERAHAVWAGIARHHVTQVVHIVIVQVKVALDVDVGVVKAVIVGPADKVTHGGGGAIGKHPRDGLDRTNVAGTAAHVPMDLLVTGEAKLAEHLGGLDLVERVVPAQQ